MSILYPILSTPQGAARASSQHTEMTLQQRTEANDVVEHARKREGENGNFGKCVNSLKLSKCLRYSRCKIKKKSEIGRHEHLQLKRQKTEQQTCFKFYYSDCVTQ